MGNPNNSVVIFHCSTMAREWESRSRGGTELFGLVDGRQSTILKKILFGTGNGTIGLEIVDCIPDISNIIVPYGGGGLICGIAIAAKAHNPNIKVYACEVETACPLKASLQAGQPVDFPYQASFVDGMGGKSILPEMWPMVKSLVTDSIVVSLQEVADAVKLLSEGNHIRAEGAGAATVAAALKGVVGKGKTACIISGGNIDTDKYIQCLQGKVPA